MWVGEELIQKVCCECDSNSLIVVDQETTCRLRGHLILYLTSLPKTSHPRPSRSVRKAVGTRPWVRILFIYINLLWKPIQKSHVKLRKLIIKLSKLILTEFSNAIQWIWILKSWNFTAALLEGNWLGPHLCHCWYIYT